MRITVLTHAETEDDKEVDIAVTQVAQALRELGHTVSILSVFGDIKKLIAGLSRRRPDLVFNMMEMWGEDIGGDIPVVGLLEMLGLHYTGCGPGEFYLGQDKALAKKILAFEGVAYPKFAVFSKNAGFETGGNLRMPLFVKPLTADASIGIEGDSLVHDATALMKRVVSIHENVKDSALAEEYIEGREFYVGVLGNDAPVVFPPIEVDFSGMPEGAPHIMGAKAKFDVDSPEYKGTKSVLAEIPDELRARLQQTALQAYRALRVRDYGRVDMRLAETGEIYVLEVNASCYLEKTSEFATSAAAIGIEYTELIGRIVELALARRAPVATPKKRRVRPAKAA
jgi:D-alanine-D-alanine ligase